jgi:tetratricopeptide (TPR) repeat protein
MRKIRLKSRKSSEFNTDFSIKKISYHIQTDEGSDKNPFITTTAYMGGIVVEQEKVPYPMKSKIERNELIDLMRKNHEQMIIKMKKKHLESPKSKAEYLKGTRKLVKRRKLKDALELIEDAHLIYHDDPFVMSFRGYLRAAVLKMHKEGIEECKAALALYNKRTLVGAEYYHNFFYLNLGKTYRVAGNTDIAVRYFRKGLEYDQNNNEIINELIQMGVRKRPAIPFLSRGNIINKYLGMVLYKLGLR